MKLYDEEEIRKIKYKNKKVRNSILIGISITTVLIVALIVAIFYLIANPNKITVYLNGFQTSKFDSALQTFQINDKNVLFVNVNEVENIFKNFKVGVGEYDTNYNDKNSCFIEGEEEATILTANSSVIYKKNLSSNTYEEIKIDQPIIQKDDNMYISIEGFKKALNLAGSYSEKTKKLSFTELEVLVQSAEENAKKLGFAEIEKENLENRKAILDDRIVVMDENEEYGIIEIKGKNARTIIKPQYDSITYIPQKQAFLIEKDRKFGIYDSEGNTQIDVAYNKLTLIDNDNDLYLAQSNNNLYGVIRTNDSQAKIPFDYETIGINTTNNGLKSGYMLFGKLIPVKQNGKWMFFQIQTMKNTDGTKNVQCQKLYGEYEEIGCITKTSRNTVSNVTVIEDYNLIVAKKNGVYGLIDTNGKEITGFVLDDIYKETISGNTEYYMVRKTDMKTFKVSDVLEKSYGITKKQTK